MALLELGENFAEGFGIFGVGLILKMLGIGSHGINYDRIALKPHNRMINLISITLRASSQFEAFPQLEFSSHDPLGILFGIYDLAVTHVNDPVAISRRIRIVRDHQHGLT